MDTVKVLGGVAAGIGTVAALPVMGKFGCVSKLGAVLGGTIGGVAGAVLSELEEDALFETKRRHTQNGHESCLKDIEALDERYSGIREELAEAEAQKEADAAEEEDDDELDEESEEETDAEPEVAEDETEEEAEATA